MITEKDEQYIRLCFELALKGKGFVSPNPLAGCIIEKEGRIIGSGYHQKFGEAHAEVNAIRSVTEDLNGATLYCNLEPCSHTDKKTDPCTPRIVYSGIKRVVVSNLDPNPKVNGNGMAMLRSCGIETEVGVFEEEGAELNKFFFKYIKEKIPFVTLKAAQSLNGKISIDKNVQTWLTGEESGKYVHQQRALYDAVLIGANTINVDNPQLDVRKVEGRNPIKVIIDGKLSINPESKIFMNEPEKVWIFTTGDSDSTKKYLLKDRRCRIFEMPSNADGKLHLMEILKTLGSENLSSVFVEGGQEVFSQFIKEKLFDELILLTAPIILPQGIDVFNLNEQHTLQFVSSEKLGEDVKLLFKKI